MSFLESCMQFMNDNEGSVMGILTFVYVIATGFICISNIKSANAAAKQLQEMKASQEQNINIQLFDKRLEVFYLLRNWCDIAKKTFDNVVTPPGASEPLSPGEVFEVMVFKDLDNPTLKNLNDQLRDLNDFYPHVKCPDGESVNLKKFKVNRDIHFAALQSVGDAKKKIDSAKYLYSKSITEQITAFSSAFFDLARSLTGDNEQQENDNMQKFLVAYNTIVNDRILEQMENQLGI